MAITLVGATGLQIDFGTTTQTGSSVAVEPDDFIVAFGKVNSTSVTTSIDVGASNTATVGTLTTSMNDIGSPTVVGQFLVTYGTVTGAGDLYMEINRSDGNPQAYMAFGVYRGVNLSNPFAASPTLLRQENDVTSAVGTNVTPSAAGDWVLSFLWWAGGSTRTATPANGFTTDYELEATSYWSGITLDHLEAASTTPISGTSTLSVATFYGAVNLALRANVIVPPGTTVARGLYL